MAPLGSQECVAFSPDASMISCVSNTEVIRIECLLWLILTRLAFCDADLDVEYAPVGCPQKGRFLVAHAVQDE